MNRDALRKLLEEIKAGSTDIDSALEQLRHLPYEDLGYARLDHHRALRTGVPEVVYCAGKTPDQVAEIMERLAAKHTRIMGTRASDEAAAAVAKLLPESKYNEVAKIIVVDREPKEMSESDPYVAVCAAGTSDLPVAEEAAVTIETLGSRVHRLWDVGVAGLHRLVEHRALLADAGAIVAVAGMEGALPSVIAGLSGGPVIAVPTSIGYGASFGGLSALLTMINSCAPGVTVVNIDNGFGAGYAAHMILGRVVPKTDRSH